MRSPWRPRTPGEAALLGASVALVTECGHLFAALAFSGVPTAADLLGRSNYRISMVVSVLIGFGSAALAYGVATERRDAARRAEELGWSAERTAAVLAASAPSPRAALGAALLVAPLGTLLITGTDTNQPFLVSDDPWTFAIAWATGANLVLFGLIGALAYFTWAWTRQERALDAIPAPIDLLDTAPDRRLAGAGLRRSFFWIVGGSSASLVFVDLEFSWMTGIVVAVALALGTALFVAPLVRLAARIARAKQAELARVSARIRDARDALLGASAPAAAAELPALLAYERRIETVRPWAIEVSQMLRFAVLVVLAIGSWLGGAIMDHVVDRFLK